MEDKDESSHRGFVFFDVAFRYPCAGIDQILTVLIVGIEARWYLRSP